MGVAPQCSDGAVRASGRINVTYLLLVAALAIFVGSLANTSLRLVRMDRDIAEGLGENLVWTVTQGEIELLRLLDSLDRLESGAAGPEEVRRRYDLFWSRLAIMREGEVGVRVAAIPRIGSSVERIAEAARELEPDIAGLATGDRARLAGIRERLRALQPMLHEAAVWTSQSELDRSMTQSQSRRGVLFEALLYLVGLLLAALLLVALLIREIRRTRRLSVAARLSEAEAKRSEQRFRDVVEAASDWVWETGPDHRFTFISDKLQDLSGERPEDLLGRTRWDLRLPDDPDDANWAAHRAALEARQPIRNFVFPHRDVDGRRHFSRIHGKPFFDSDGRILGYRGTGRDITAELEAAQEIANSRQLLRAIIDAVPAVINVKDRELRYVLMNAFEAEVYGIDADAVIGKTTLEVLGTEFGLKTQDLDREVLINGKELPFLEREFVDRYGSKRFWWSAKKPLLDDGGAVRHIVTVALDVTQLKATERARNNLSRYFSPNMVEVLAGADESLRQVRSHDAGILFADIVGFSGFISSERPEQAFEMVREFHARMARIVFRYGGTLDKYIGDGLMASFGTPQPGPLDATHTLQCARAMAQEISDWNWERTMREQERVRIAVGAHYGPVLLGDIGDERRLEFAVLGETVNVASRLEAMTRQLGVPVVISEELVEAAYAEVGIRSPESEGFTSLGRHEIRGTASSVGLWALQEPEPGAARGRRSVAEPLRG
jgi:PAS domain S-box-containing protein